MKHLHKHFVFVIKKRGGGSFHHTLSLLSTIFKRINVGGGAGKNVLISGVSGSVMLSC